VAIPAQPEDQGAPDETRSSGQQQLHDLNLDD
jgi:hypothetical protein